ncbi:ABC transporter ATP-binding protein/permease [Streptomyces sp. LX-29]|uniref:ABC transporter ATP-binding protein n=1 Tax=Streptomyces sp. LX-29 TaxID=2900152 RepID=UPI00240E0586|nr:ABC transporter ATP-binding protein [Streptomyces sp. LX-29]WFB05768.1 ABC transporter ATP-binding protein/permease [Streptomyces sp. LX-29]
MSRSIRLALGIAFRAAPWVLAGHLAVTLISAGLPVAVTWVVKSVLDRLADGAGVQEITWPAVLLAVASAVAALAPQVLGYLQARMTRATSLLAQERLHTAVDTFTGLSRFENPEFLDRLRLAQQAGGLAPFQVVQAVAGMTRSGVLLVGFIVSLAVLNPYLAAVVGLSGLPVLWAEIALSRQRARTYWAISPTERREIFYATLLSSVEAAKEVRLYGIGGFLRERMLTERRTADSHRERLERRELRVQSLLQIASAVLTGAALIWAVRAAARQDMTVGDVSMLLAAIPAVQGGIGGLAREVGQAHHSLVMFHHYVSVIGLGPDLPAPRNPRVAHPLRDAIEVEDVWFRYGDGLPWVLRGVNLRIEAGRALALVGVNGSGKSTLVKLLCRFYDPTRGRILWDGTDLRDIPPGDLRARIAATFQEPMRYDLSARENIGVGELGALQAPDRQEEAARFAGVHEDITRLPRGYETLLSRSFWDDDEDGVVLSGGQWQRMGIARLFLRADADLLVLDEPTSSLDPDAEYEIHTRLRAHRAGRTSVLISHRLGAIRDADTIAVLEDGRITERGDHRRLMARQGTYHRLFTRQSRNYRDEVTSVPGTTDPYGDETAVAGGGLGA